MRMEWENMKRMVGTSLLFVVLFSVAGVSLLYRQHETIPQWVLGVLMLGGLLWQISFGIYSFWWLQQRNRIEAKR